MGRRDLLAVACLQESGIAQDDGRVAGGFCDEIRFRSRLPVDPDIEIVLFRIGKDDGEIVSGEGDPDEGAGPVEGHFPAGNQRTADVRDAGIGTGRPDNLSGEPGRQAAKHRQ